MIDGKLVISNDAFELLPFVVVSKHTYQLHLGHPKMSYFSAKLLFSLVVFVPIFFATLALASILLTKFVTKF